MMTGRPADDSAARDRLDQVFAAVMAFDPDLRGRVVETYGLVLALALGAGSAAGHGRPAGTGTDGRPIQPVRVSVQVAELERRFGRLLSVVSEAVDYAALTSPENHRSGRWYQSIVETHEWLQAVRALAAAQGGQDGAD